MSAKDLQYIKEAWEGMNSTPVKPPVEAADDVIDIEGWAEEWSDTLGDASLEYIINNFELVSDTLRETLTDELRYRRTGYPVPD
tara:strand:- start:14683 stop:14934 length:252 start_codon:yes stop_codon:yes gene_type:complete